MRTYTIPVAFHVKGDDELDAARRLSDRLVERKVLDLFIDEPIESWWMPNHPAADGSDEEQALLWVDIGYQHPSTAKERQAVVNQELGAYGSGVSYLMARRILADKSPGLVFTLEQIEKAMSGYKTWGDEIVYVYQALEENLHDAGLIKYEDEA